jgi:hypothetical protein
MGMDYQINQEVDYAGKKGIIKQVYGDGWLQIEVCGKLKDVFYDEIIAKPLEQIKLFGRPTYVIPGTISNSIIQRKNGGIRHQFQNSIGGDSSNYR